MVGPSPRISPFVLGILAERSGVDADIEVDWCFEEGSGEAYALRELVRSEHGTVVHDIVSELRSTGLLATMWVCSRDGVRFPLPAAVLDLVLNTNVSGDKMAALGWIEDGMSID